MASITKLSVRGVRAFSPDDAEQVRDGLFRRRMRVNVKSLSRFGCIVCLCRVIWRRRNYRLTEVLFLAFTFATVSTDTGS